MRRKPLSNRRSLSSVSSAFRMALLALKISSMKATSAVGRYPSILRTYSSFSRPGAPSGAARVSKQIESKVQEY